MNDTSVDSSEHRPPLREVDDSEYVAKIFGCEANTLYGGDTEMTSSCVKDSIIPFDLLCEDTAENNDLWVEYALATKGVKSFFFSRGLEGRVQKYFELFPDRDPVKPLPKSDNVVAQISRDAYHFFYRSFKVDEMLRVATKGYEVLREWCRQVYIDSGISEECITEEMLPQSPGSHSWFIDERCRPLTNSVDVLTNSQTRDEHDNVSREGQSQSSSEPSVHGQSEQERVAQPEREEARLNDNVCHVDGEVRVSVTSSDVNKHRWLFSTPRRGVYQPSLFEPKLTSSKTRREDVLSVERPESRPESVEKISPSLSRPVAVVEPRRSIFDIIDEAVAAVDLEALGCADFEQYLDIWNSNNDSAKSCREFLQAQSREVVDVKAILDLFPLVPSPEDEPPSEPPSSPPMLSDPPDSSLSVLSRVEFSSSSLSTSIPQTHSMFSQQLSESSSLLSGSLSSEFSLPTQQSLESSVSLSSELSEVQMVCDGEEVTDQSPFECVATDSAVEGAYVGDLLPRVVYRSPLTVIRETCAHMVATGQQVDWPMVESLLNELGDNSLSTLDLMDRARLGLDIPGEDKQDEPSLSDVSETRPAYLDEEVDISFQARYDEVSKSKWYPEWYRARMAGLAQASKKATKTDTNDLELIGRFFMVNDFYE